MAKYNIKLKRVYEPPEETDGFRILIDRLWPRGLSKDKAKIDLWLKEIAPSNELRRWFKHDAAKWQEFQKRYAKELHSNQLIIEKLKQLLAEKQVVTLLFAATDQHHNNAVAFKKILNLE